MFGMVVSDMERRQRPRGSASERRQQPRGSASVELWRTVRAAASASALCDSALSGCALSEPWHARHAVRLRAVVLRPVGATARALLLLVASALRVRAARARNCWRETAGGKLLAGKCWRPRRPSAGVRADRAAVRQHGPDEHCAVSSTTDGIRCTSHGIRCASQAAQAR